jgi:hypothetical protein
LNVFLIVGGNLGKMEIKKLLGLHDVDFSLELTIIEVSLHLLLVKGALMLDL